MTTQDLNGLRLYLITDRSLFDGEKKFLDAVEAALIGGVKTIQLREKDLSDYQLVETRKKTTFTSHQIMELGSSLTRDQISPNK